MCCSCYRNLVILLDVVFILEGLLINRGYKGDKCRFDTDGCGFSLCWWLVGHNLFSKSASIDLTNVKNDP